MSTAQSRFTSQTLREILSRVSLADVVREKVTLKRKGKDWWGCCPFHHEKSASFHVRESHGYYHCFGCGAHGNAIDFMMETRGLPFPESVEILAERAGVTLERREVDPAEQQRRQDGYAALEAAKTWFERSLGGQAKAYLEKRRLSPETISFFKLGHAPDAWRDLKNHLLNEGFSLEVLREAGLIKQSDKGGEDYDTFRSRLMFPITDLRGRTIAFGGRIIGDDNGPKYLNSPDTPFFNKSRTLYNLQEAASHVRTEKRLLLVEGYMDAIALWQAGIKTAVAPLGTAVTAEQIEILWRHHDQPIVCLDGDDAGRKAAIRTAERALEVMMPGKGLRFVWLPDGHDPDSLIQEKGTDAFKQLLDNTQTHEDILWQHISDGIDLQSGEGRATVDAAIGTLGNQIKDARLKKYILGALNDRLWATIRKGRGGSTNQARSRVTSEKGAGSAKNLLLAMVLHTPALLPRIEEPFSELSFQDETLERLRQTVFRAFLSGRVDMYTMSSYLKEVGMDDVAALLIKRSGVVKTLDEHNITDKVDEIETFWLDVFADIQQGYQNKKASQDILSELGENILSDTDAWEKFKNLRMKNTRQGSD